MLFYESIPNSEDYKIVYLVFFVKCIFNSDSNMNFTFDTPFFIYKLRKRQVRKLANQTPIKIKGQGK